MSLIIEDYIINADNTDVLKGPSRLVSMPYDGIVVLEASALRCVGNIGATPQTKRNFALLQVNLPDSQVPLMNITVPANGYDTENCVLHDDTKLHLEFPMLVGAHLLVSVEMIKDDDNDPDNALYLHFTATEDDAEPI